MIETTTLDNGITVVTERMPWVRSVSAGFWVGTGSRDEGEGLFGASHFLEHLLFKGTPTRTARGIAEDVDAVGGDMNAFTTREYTAFYLRVLDDSVDLALDILSDILWNPAFRADEVEAERQVILEEILMRADEPADLVHEVFTEALFPDHPVGREVLGDEPSIENMSREAIAAFHRHHYRPGNMVFAAAGNLHHEALVEGVERRFAGGAGGAAPVRTAPVVPPRGWAIDPRPTEQAHLVVGMRAFDVHSEDRHALSVVNHVLGGGMSSRLFQTIREERGLAYSVYSYRSLLGDTGMLSVYAGTMPARLREVLDLVRDGIDSIAAGGITERELEVAKGHVVGELALSLEDSAARMSRIGRCQLIHGTVPTVDEVVASVAAVTLDDAARVAAEVLGNPQVVAVVGPVDDGFADAAQVA
ncbi:MAG TPA: pitrilysin family protein [Acidimicrobiales bacterium]|nr:pitrilysin family protein [Acidimicrobiales bacterium]